MARNKKVEILSNDKEVLHPMTDGDCVIFEDGQTLTQKLSEDDSVKYTPEIVNSSPMFKVGEGNTVDYSDNVLDGAYERATLQGQTYVNYIQESSADEVTLPTPFTEYERTQHNTLTSDEEGVLGINLVGQSYVNALQHDSEEEFVVLGESLEFQEKKVEYTSEGQIKSAMLKGQTLVNLNHPTSKDEYRIVDEERWQTLTVWSSDYNTWSIEECACYKPNTKYFAIVEVVENTLTNLFYGMAGSSNSTMFTGDVETLIFEPGETGVKRGMFTSRADFTNVTRGVRSSTETNGTVGTHIKFRIMVVEYQDGIENWDIPYFEGMQSVTVSTRLENLCHKYNDGLAKNGKTFTTNSLSDRCIKLVDYKEGAEATYGMKPNTKYLIQFKISNLVLDGLSSLGMVFSVGESGTTNYLFKDATKTGLITANGIYRVVLTTTDLVSTSGVEIKGIADEWENSGSSLRSMTISEIMYVEYQNGMENWDLPYFEDYQVMKPVQVESISKNLFDGELEVGTIATADGTNANASAYNQYCRTKNYIKVKPSTAYRITYDIDYDNVLVYFYSSDKSYIDYQSIINDKTNIVKITTPNNCKYMRFRFVNNTTLLNDKSIQLEESSTATEYVPHQSKTTYSWDEVILRKVGDVEDTLDLTTGEWVQRIGEIVLDGSETWKMDAEASANNSCMFYTGVDFGGFQHFEHYEDREKYQLCDKFKIKADTYYLDENCIMVNQDARIYCRILKTQLSSPDVTGFQEWLKTNNVKISTLLAKPIVHKVNLSRPNLQVYDDITHIHTKCLDGTLIPNIYLPSDISYPAILEPGKKYNVCVNHTEVSADNPLKVNVGGTEITMTDSRMTLTTPTTLANSNVSFTGKGNKIKESMLIKNSSLLTRDLPHFNGIGSVQLGRTIENLCGSKYIKGGGGQAQVSASDDTIQATITTKGSYVFEFPLLTPLENGKTYFCYAPLQGEWVAYSFVATYNNIKKYTYQPNSSDGITNPTHYIVTIDQKDNQYVSFCMGSHGPREVGETFIFTRPIVCEYEPGMENWDWESIGYFTGTKNIGNEFMRVSNSDATKYNGLYITKDQPISLTWEQGRINPSGVGDSYTNAINNAVSYGIRTKGLLNLKPNTTYRISLGDKVSFKYHIAVFDNWDNALPSVASLGISGDWISSVDTIFTTTKDAHKIGINVQKQDAGSITPPESVHAQVRLEEVTDVVLRSCSSKYDELDLTRGTYTQNVGMVYLDGINALSQQITIVGDTYQPTDTTLKSFDIRCVGALLSSKCSCNKFPGRDGGVTSADISFESVCIHSSNQSCRLTISAEKASTLEEFKLWLQDNPLEIIYQLKTPIIHKVHIGNKNEANTEVTKPNDVFTLPTLYTEQTHIDLTNNGIIPKVQSRDYIAYPVLPMISRTYTLQHNLTGGVSNLTVDLLGRTQEITYQNHKSLVYAPEAMDAILHNELRISGKGKISGVMYIDGGYMDRDIPYIEGMKNACNPIVKNIGKNLYKKDYAYLLHSNTYIATHYYATKPGIKIQRNTNYIMTFETTSPDTRIMGYSDGTKVTDYLAGNMLPSRTRFIFNSGNCNGLSFYRQVNTGLTLDYKVCLSEIDTDEPYKENICYVDCGEIRLTPDMFEQGSVGAANVGSHYNSDKADSSYRIRTKELIKLEIGEQYVFLGNNDKYKYSVRFYDMNGNKVSHSTTYDLSWKGTTPFTILNDAPMCAFFIKKANDSVITVDDTEAFNFQLVKVSEIKQLRSLPNGVHDEIDLETGEYIQRVGEITFNGTESWIVGYASWSNKYTYFNNTFVDIKVMQGDGSGQPYYDAVRCPQLHRSYMGRLANALIDGICSYWYGGYQRIFISKQDCATVEELKLWLQENPITVQYELPEPIVKDIVIHNYPHLYEGGHVIIENGDPNTPIPAQLTYRAVTNRSGQIQQHTEQVEKQEREINELETLILANIHLSQTR